MKIFNSIFIVLFILSAGLQYNDPDPYLWMPIYLYAAFLCYLALKKKYSPVLYILAFVVYISYAVYLLFDRTGVLDWLYNHHAEDIVQTMYVAKPWIEETREFGGLLIILIVLSINTIWFRKKA